MDIVLCLRSYANGATMGRTSTDMAMQAAAEIERLRGMLDRMDSELRNERDPRSVVQRALLMAAMLPRNQDKTAGAVRAAAVELFGQEGVDAAMQVWRA